MYTTMRSGGCCCNVACYLVYFNPAFICCQLKGEREKRDFKAPLERMLCAHIFCYISHTWRAIDGWFLLRKQMLLPISTGNLLLLIAQPICAVQSTLSLRDWILRDSLNHKGLFAADRFHILHFKLVALVSTFVGLG